MSNKKVPEPDIIYLDDETEEENKNTGKDNGFHKAEQGREQKNVSKKAPPKKVKKTQEKVAKAAAEKPAASKKASTKGASKKGNIPKEAAAKATASKPASAKNASSKSDDLKMTSPKAVSPHAVTPKRKGKGKAGWKKAAMGVGIVVLVLALAYGGVSAYFMSHFFMNTEINGYDFSAKSASEAEEFWKKQVADYTLAVKENNGHAENIKAADIDMAYKDEDAFDKLLEEQNAFLWPVSFFQDTKKEVPIEVSYDETKLEQRIAEMECLKKEQIPSVSAYPKYDGEKFVAEKEVIGTEVNKENLNRKIKESMEELTPMLDMEEEECYAYPKYTSESPEVKKACDDMNLYLKASITYKMDTDVVLDKDTISTWLSTDENMNVIFSEDAVKTWLSEFGDKYDTYDKVRNFTTPWGRAVEVQPGKTNWGGYGWAVDEGTEFNAIMENIRDGAVVEREPAYLIGQRAAVHGNPDWGGTYLEVDITAQHMWYVKDGQIAFECDVITGLPNPTRKTPDGVYRVLEKCTDYTMTGNIDPATGEPEYVSHVDYWMRVTWGGVGFHDATWQPGFGGELYKTYGSHGCINMSYSSIQTLYPMVEVGTPIVIHY